MSGAGTLPQLVVITQASVTTERLLEALEDLAPLAPRVAVQLRRPELRGRAAFEEAKRVLPEARSRGIPLFVHGRLDLALLLETHLHAAAHGPAPRLLRPHLPAHLWLSAAVHDRAESEAAQGATFALLSPFFPAGSKPGDVRAPLGAEGFEALARHLSCPAYALGGLTADNARSLPPSARGLAVVSSFWQSQSPRSTAAQLLAAVYPDGAPQLKIS